jgi:hypothetical protein
MTINLSRYEFWNASYGPFRPLPTRVFHRYVAPTWFPITWNATSAYHTKTRSTRGRCLSSSYRLINLIKYVKGALRIIKLRLPNVEAVERVPLVLCLYTNTSNYITPQYN